MIEVFWRRLQPMLTSASVIHVTATHQEAMNVHAMQLMTQTHPLAEALHYLS